jgi:nucleoside-diphosphate-sugar epimerase
MGEEEEGKKMTTLVLGASGATGRLLVEQLLNRGEKVRVIVRSPDKLPAALTKSENLTVIGASLLELTDSELSQHVSGCHAVASCLGHNLSLKGIYGHPRKLVTDATRRLCNAIKANKPEGTTKFVLMNTAGNSNRDLHEPISFGQRLVIGLLRLLLPPHVDNEKAADYLRTKIGQHDEVIEWAAVRPDSLIDEEQITEYNAYASPTRSAIFDAGLTSRINVAHFMADLITNEEIWNKWKGQMPVIYNKA